LLFGGQSGCFLRLRHKGIIDFDVGAHRLVSALCV
jgi:hypothetical protein